MASIISKSPIVSALETKRRSSLQQNHIDGYQKVDLKLQIFFSSLIKYIQLAELVLIIGMTY